MKLNQQSLKEKLLLDMEQNMTLQKINFLRPLLITIILNQKFKNKMKLNLDGHLESPEIK
jgi:hypothetical protein